MRLTPFQLAELRRLLSLSTDIAVMPASIIVALLDDYEQLLKIANVARLYHCGQPRWDAVGIRHAESEARAKMDEWEWSEGFDCEVYRPIIEFSEQQVIDIHARHGLRPNPLYLAGAMRVGCWPCIYARKGEIRLLADNDPTRIELIRQLEIAVRFAQLERRVRRLSVFQEGGADAMTVVDRKALLGDDGQPKAFQSPSWFQAPVGDTGACWPIDKVVEWSRTSRGGRQFEMFAANPADAGCMRWGLCDTVGVEP